MILTNRKFERETPHREAKSIYIFCEGAKREYEYFDYFKEIDSRINVEVYELNPHEDNSPLGLFLIAQKNILITEENPTPKFSFQPNDEVWLVFDIDKDKSNSRAPQINLITDEIKKLDSWSIAQSNPCFEVWLYYHLHTEKPNFDGNEYCKSWKKQVNDSINGGFDCRKHPIYIQSAQINSERNFELENLYPNIGSTDLFKLSKSILPLVEDKLNKVLAELNHPN